MWFEKVLTAKKVVKSKTVFVGFATHRQLHFNFDEFCQLNFKHTYLCEFSIAIFPSLRYVEDFVHVGFRLHGVDQGEEKGRHGHIQPR